jgi:hypothetical protein
LIIDDLKAKAALKVTEDVKKNADLKAFVEQGLAKTTKTV